ncbi:hypothetical protein IV203_003089 [Nitzschia inconspicua]|uniref:Uncharacterized protein n=1 Tax=Nitzschia inconspicua TaxID=303405 RepID=A0A9K3L191_9STRA|nr:hypothetical protein IV203_003089 [Nitzschia inconspicua]
MAPSTPKTGRYMARKWLLSSVVLIILGVSRLFLVPNPSLQNVDRSLWESLASTANNHVDQISIMEGYASLQCLRHTPQQIQHGRMAGSIPNQTILQHATATHCGRLRRQWWYNPVLSDYAQAIQRHQSNCTLPLAAHFMDNTFGLGSHLLLWGQAMCNAMENGHRLQSYTSSPWIWSDQTHCDTNANNTSPMHCYFPKSEQLCLNDRTMPSSINVSDPRQQNEWCQLVKNASQEEEKEYIRAASTEFIFQQISPIVIQEAQRQIGLIFPDGVVPEDLVTVHIRWGDKFWEMDLVSIEEYIYAINKLLQRHHGMTPRNNTIILTANIFLATEDPRAYQEFMQAKPPEWNVYADITLQEIDAFRPRKGNRASWAARNTKGRSGLIALGSLLVAMEANLFVLTTKSNWSTLMNQLRTQVVDPRCGNCTDMMDLRPGNW